MTVMLLIALIFYGTMQSVKLLTFDETDVMVSKRDSFFDADFVYDEGIFYAFGITAYDSNDQPIEDPTYGVLKPYYKSWGIKENVKGVDFEELPTRKCKTAELHIGEETDPKSKFSRPHPNSQSDLDFYYRKLKCLDLDRIEVQGDYNSPTTRSFVLLFEKCNSETYEGPGTCKSDEEIRQWLARKFILIYQNNQRFETRVYEFEKKVQTESRTVWIPINSQIREEIVFKIQLTDLRLQDTYYQFSALTEDDRRIFGNV